MSPGLRAPLGAVLGAGASLAVAVWEGDSSSNTGMFVGESIGLTGLPIGILLGWRFADRVGRSNPFGLVGWMGASAVLLGDVLVSVGIAAVNLLEGDPVMAGLFPFLLIFGLAFGVLILPITVVAAIAWLCAFLLFDWLLGRVQAKGPGVAGASGAGREVSV